MPFVRRNADGKIDAVFQTAENGAEEEIAIDHPELRAFLVEVEAHQVEDEWLKADLSLARVIEDLIGVLIDKGVISFTDLPHHAQEKLIQRKGLRQELSYVAKLFGHGEEDGYL